LSEITFAVNTLGCESQDNATFIFNGNEIFNYNSLGNSGINHNTSSGKTGGVSTSPLASGTNDLIHKSDNSCGSFVVVESVENIIDCIISLVNFSTSGVREDESRSFGTLTDITSDDGFVFMYAEIFPPVDEGFHVVKHIRIPEIVSFHSSDESIVDNVNEFTT